MKSALTIAPVLAGVILSGTVDAANVRIIGGDKVSLEQYPYMAALVTRGDSAEQAFCGASVINAKWIMTAAHCLQGASADSLDVLTGVSVLSKTETGQRIAAARIVVHPDYDDNALVNDIALIELSSPTNAPAVKAATSADIAAFSTGQAVSVSGWGNLLTNGEQYPDVLHAVDLQVSDFTSCSDAYGGLVRTQICATVPGGQKDSCQGDSGGPLVAKTATGPIQVGVVSFGDACASATHPGVYTKVSEFTDFLSQAGVVSSTQVATDANAPVDNNDNGSNFESESGADEETVLTESENVGPTEMPSSSQSNVEMVVIDPFYHVMANESSWGTVEFYNAGANPISISNIQLPQNVSISEFSDDCTAYELRPEEACYTDINWKPVNSTDLIGVISVDIYDGSENETMLVPLTGAVLEPVEIGHEIDWPTAEYYSTFPEEWDVDNTDVTAGDSAVSSSMQNTDTLNLVGEFGEQDAYELEFEYQLDGVNCYIYLDDQLAYELAAFEQWQSATVDVPAGAQVRFEFKAMSRDRGERKVRLDALKVNAVSETGAGSAGKFSVIGLLLLLTIRGLVTGRRRSL